MAASILAVGTEIPGGAPLRKKGTISLSVRAARKVLKQGNLDPNDLGLLINSSVYKDENIGEPAMASFIQRDIEANRFPSEGSSTFAFDILDSGCGLLTGLELIDGLIESGNVENGIIVTSDVNPSVKYTIGFKFKNSAAAILIGRSNDGSGFRGFRQFEYPEDRETLESSVEFRKDPRRSLFGIRRMRNIHTIEESPTYHSQIFKRMKESMGPFLDDMGVKPGDIDLVISSQYPPGIIGEISKMEGIGKDKVITLPKNYGPLYTTGPGFSLRWAMKKGIWNKAQNVLFLAVGPGIKVSLALYENIQKK
jgi:3-oxoacyl-[acyl-carrier-protein] synthase-3